MGYVLGHRLGPMPLLIAYAVARICAQPSKMLWCRQGFQLPAVLPPPDSSIIVR